MGYHHSVTLSLLFLVQYTCVVYGKVYYITASSKGPCPQNSSCLTISQFAVESSHNDTDISLLFLPGNHTLDRAILLAQLINFSMAKDGPDNETVLVHCSTHSGRFLISEITSVSINDLHFIGCGSNILSRVKWLTIAGSTFESGHNSDTVLVLSEINTATVVRSFFLSNLLRSWSVSANVVHFIAYVNKDNLLEYIYDEPNKSNGVLFATFSNVSVISCEFIHNRADIGGAVVAHYSSLYLANNIFSNNTANFGGVIATTGSTITVDTNTFISNAAQWSGGCVVSFNDTITISNGTFTNNTAEISGGVIMIIGYSAFSVTTSTFSYNSASKYAGVIYSFGDSLFTVSSSTFTNNSVRSLYGGVVVTFGHNNSFVITSSTFTFNSAQDGGVFHMYDDSRFNITASTFSSNSARITGGVINVPVSFSSSLFTLSDSVITDNRALYSGVMSVDKSIVSINSCIFANNSAGHDVIEVSHSILKISDSTFSNSSSKFSSIVTGHHNSSVEVMNSVFRHNQASHDGGVINCIEGRLTIAQSDFSSNAISIREHRMMVMFSCSTHISSSTFDQNFGSLYIFNSNLTLGGSINFETFNMMQHDERDEVRLTSQQGGVVTSFQSTVFFATDSMVRFSNNGAQDGGAILATESTIIMNGEVTIANNVANGRGGGISLKQSRLEIKGNCQILRNIAAVGGGGIYASSSTLSVYQPGTLKLTNNSAVLGGGVYLGLNAKLYILKTQAELNYIHLMTFVANHADTGGAVYVADDTNSGACSPENECFIQILALHQSIHTGLNTISFFFSENTANEHKSNIFGGLLDRCITSPFAEVFLRESTYYSGVTYLEHITNISVDTISSLPLSVCFCNSEHEPDCSYQPSTIRAQKGQVFNVSLVAVDQVNHTVAAKIIAFLSSSEGGFGEGQQTQQVGASCTNVTFNVFSPHDLEILNLYPDGPCENSTLSTSQVTIKFTECICPVGFEPLSLSTSQSSTRCECDCDSALSPYITECDITTSSVIRRITNAWITFINDTNTSGYVIYPNCPFDYCYPQTENITINFNLPNPLGADSQCAFDRTGILCGACRKDLSLSLASSRCVPCRAYWPAVFVVTIVFAAIAGILLVTALLALNMTVSVGLINGFIFYANVVSAGSSIFFPSSEPSFPSVFVAWLNLDIGIDVCFIDGLDAYTKTWLQLTFPIYIISLVVMVIIVSKYSSKFARFIGQKDPVSTLATLILLSYAKLLSITITALSSAVLRYPNGVQETVWLPDGNVPYFQGKHIPLAVVALLLIVVGLPYTLLLLLWQLILRAPSLKLLQWRKDTKLNTFVSTHHVPHNSRHRYWTGLLLVVRVVLYVTISVTLSANPQTFPLITGFLVGGLVLFKGLFMLKVYRKAFVDMVDTILYFNLLALAFVSQYEFKANIIKQTTVAYISVIITFLLCIGAVIYHVRLLIKRKRSLDKRISPPVSPKQPSVSAVTHSVIERPIPEESEGLSPLNHGRVVGSNGQEITEDYQNVTSLF